MEIIEVDGIKFEVVSYEDRAVLVRNPNTYGYERLIFRPGWGYSRIPA